MTQTAWAVVASLCAVSWFRQSLFWSAVLSATANRREFLAVWRLWVFPPSPSAFAVSHHKNLVSAVFGTPLRALTRLLSSRMVPASHRSHTSYTQKMISLTLVAVLVSLLALLTGAWGIAVGISVLYGLVFPWGAPYRVPTRGLSAPRLFAGAVLAALVAILTIHQGLLGFVVAIFTAPLLICLLGTPRRAEIVAPQLATGNARNGAAVFDATTLRTFDDMSKALDAFLASSPSGTRFLVFGGLDLRDSQASRHTSLLVQRAHAKEVRTVSVGRTNADTILDACDGRASRVDTHTQAISWINDRLLPDDAVLYLGTWPFYLP
jgi:hypothetical protein